MLFIASLWLSGVKSNSLELLLRFFCGLPEYHPAEVFRYFCASSCGTCSSFYSQEISFTHKQLADAVFQTPGGAINNKYTHIIPSF